MANEISLTLGLTVNKPSIMSSAVARSFQNLVRNMNSNYIVGPTSMLVPTAATLIPLGNVSLPHYGWVFNTDVTNFMTIRNGPNGADLIQLYPGDMGIIPFNTTAALYAVANVANLIMEYMICGY